MIELKKETERVILVGVCLPWQEDIDASLEELSELAKTAGAVTVGKVVQSRDQVHPGTYVGKGKIDEIKSLLWELDATGIICDDELSPAQMKNLQDELDAKVMDRTLVILDIFAARASTSEGKIQVELAQLKYRQTRLAGFGTAMSRLGGGIGTRGPGEKKLEMDRRLIKNRIALLNRELKSVKQHREVTREKRAKIHIVYSPADAEKYAKDHPEEQVTFLSVGFETTTPAGCLSVKQAKEDGISNYSLLVANKTMPGAYEALKGSANVFLYPGHVNAITGTELCEELVKEGVSGVVAGFTAKELLTALAVALVRFQEGKPFFVNCYPRVVTREGSREAQRLVNELMEGCDSEWRGLGIIPGSGMQLREEWEAYDARKKYNMPKIEGKANPACRCGDVLQGKCKPSDCKVFGKVCTPQHPVGACMVSGEGSCSAYYQYS